MSVVAPEDGAVVGHALAEATDAGETLVLVLGDPAFYGRFRFEPASEVGITGPCSGARLTVRRLDADAPVGEAVHPPVVGRLEAGEL